jgi:tetratricopeptide (TPR) repeat protein
MTPLRAVLSSSVLAAYLLACPLPAAAQPASTADAQAHAADLKKRGDDLLDAKRYAEALSAYDEAYAIEPSPALLYNRGRALQFLGRNPEALEALERFAAEAPRDLLERVRGLPQLLEDLRSRVGMLVVSSPVAGARVLVNDRQIGVTPLPAATKLDAGHLRIDAFADGYFPFHRELDLAGRSTLRLDLALVSRETSGVLVVHSHVGDARVSVDDRLAALAPLEAGLFAGPHRVVASRNGYDPAATQIVLRAGERTDVWLDPIRQAPLLTRWWFWTAVGAVVVGGVVAYVALSTEKSPPSGDWSPGVVHF